MPALLLISVVGSLQLLKVYRALAIFEISSYNEQPNIQALNRPQLSKTNVPASAGNRLETNGSSRPAVPVLQQKSEQAGSENDHAGSFSKVYPTPIQAQTDDTAPIKPFGLTNAVADSDNLKQGSLTRFQLRAEKAVEDRSD